MDNLVQKLSGGPHPVVIGGPKISAEELKNRIENIGYVFIKFTETQGGTDLGVRIDSSKTRMENADFSAGMGKIHIEGTLILNFIAVRCVADINIEDMAGVGNLRVEDFE